MSQPVMFYVVCWKRPDLLELQQTSFKRYLKDDFRHTVIDNGWDDVTAKTKATAARLGMEYLRSPTDEPPGYTGYAGRHARALNYGWEQAGAKYPGISVQMHEDVFLFRPFSVVELLGDCHFAGKVDRARGNGERYLNPLMMVISPEAPERDTFDFRLASDWQQNWCDTGSAMRPYFKRHPELRVREMRWGDVPVSPLAKLALTVGYSEAVFGGIVIEGSFFHLGGVCGWDKAKTPEVEVRREAAMQRMFDTLVGDSR